MTYLRIFIDMRSAGGARSGQMPDRAPYCAPCASYVRVLPTAVCFQRPCAAYRCGYSCAYVFHIA